MEEVTFELKSGFESFQAHRADGTVIVLKEGEPRTTKDPEEIGILSAEGAQHAVKRAAKGAAKEKES